MPGRGALGREESRKAGTEAGDCGGLARRRGYAAAKGLVAGGFSEEGRGARREIAA